MTENNSMYLIGRAKIYRDEAQRGIELESQGENQRAQLVWKSLKRACEAELANYSQQDEAYLHFLQRISASLQDDDALLADLELIRLASRQFLSEQGR
ncbi:hypothetical protein LFYK43_09600 [Ligilactobacillus salitolerans]|uniref:Uncharacterized protein n=1 Tax=Ligilactobacillus salitolerans TaxID=1808352 RepID=A0A401ISK7_9LACO|nr:hypothetical protein [Ligilactobacillus salitolerans]GBG94501.1 hypothetical protein LFYK43_09600 [Ligilactobacillus salitolerans]